MEILFFYLIVSVLFVLLVAHILERYGMILLAGVIFFTVLYFYLPPEKINSLLGLKNEETTPYELPEGSRINEPPQKEKETVYIVVPKIIEESLSPPKEHSFQTPIPPTPNQEEPTFESISVNCNLNKYLFDHYVLIDVFVKQEENASTRVDELRNHGFPEAFYVYLPCYKSRIPDEKGLFAIIVGEPCKLLSEIQKMEATCIQRAKANNIELISNEKILKLESKNHLVLNEI